MNVFLTGVFVFVLLVQKQVQTAAETEHDSLKSIPEEDFEKFLEIQTALFRSNRLDQGVVESTLQSHLELISNLNQAMSFLLDKIDYLQGQLGEMEEKLQQTDLKANDALEKYKSCITDVKFGAIEQSPLWRGPGFRDQKSYVITGVSNGNSDDFTDDAWRRRYQVYRNGTWSDPLWE